METRVTPWITCKDGPWYPTLQGGGFAAYRIWQQFDGRTWFQSHEWRRADGSAEMGPWLHGAEGWCKDTVQAEVAV